MPAKSAHPYSGVTNDPVLVVPGALPIVSLPCKASVSPVYSLLASPPASSVSPLGNFVTNSAVLDDSTLYLLSCLTVWPMPLLLQSLVLCVLKSLQLCPQFGKPEPIMLTILPTCYSFQNFP